MTTITQGKETMGIVEMIAGKTHSEILSMTNQQRCQWYKTISPEEKEEAMRIVDIAGRAKNKASHIGKKNYWYGKTRSKEARVQTRMWWTLERRAERSKAMTGKNNPSFGKSPSEGTRDKIGASKIGKKNYWYGKKNLLHSEFMMGKNNPMKRPEVRTKISGEKNHNWQGGTSFEPYGLEFNAELKRQTRNRDNHTCQECHQTEEELGYALCVHHIDYDKKNNSPENLISLCKSCHSQTNFGREDWTEYFRKIMEAAA